MSSSKQQQLPAKPITEQEFKFIFDAFDRDHTGQISVSELGNLLRSCGLNSSETVINNYMQRFDKNQGGTLDFGESKTLFEMCLKSDLEDELVQAFRKMDANNNGFIEKDELKRVLSDYGDKRIITSSDVNQLVKMMLASSDQDANTKIDYYEFSRAMAASVVKKM